MKTILFVLVATVLFCTPVSAQDLDGQSNSDEDPNAQANCAYYIGRVEYYCSPGDTYNFRICAAYERLMEKWCDSEITEHVHTLILDLHHSSL